MIASRSCAALLFSLLCTAAPQPSLQDAARVDRALDRARIELERGRHEAARESLMAALERDPNRRAGWQLLARYATALDDKDLLLWALYRDYGLGDAQGWKAAEREAALEAIRAVEPSAAALIERTRAFVAGLAKLGARYEKELRPHGAIRVYQRLLALDPENAEAQAAIERLASAPDPSLAPYATARDPFEGIDQAWIDAFDEQHNTWEEAAREERDNYITITDTGYKNLIRTADAMEQVNAFYREFFRYGGPDDGRNVSRITVHLFKDKDEYLKKGFSPVEWSAGHFTGSHVETYLPENGFEGVVGTLFHEAAHQFVSLATSASGWLNEGLASFFEGTRILANGTVVMNLPAHHRLFPLAKRMEAGWMTNPTDGLPKDGKGEPTKAPTFRILVENDYAWGPPWYAPTWGLVYFLYNYQDPWDGRYLYRAAFGEFINSSGGRVGKGAAENFEEVVLKSPAKPLTKERPKDQPEPRLAKSIDELDQLWKAWMLELRDRATGARETPQPYLRWARLAAEAGLKSEAKEHYERALLEDPLDGEALSGLADLLIEQFQREDRAVVLLEQYLRVLEADPECDPLELARLERRLKKLDPDRRRLTEIEEDLLKEAEGLLIACRDQGYPRLVMEWARRLGRDFGEARFYDLYGDMVQRVGGSIDLWRHAYNEENLDGWVYGEATFQPAGPVIEAHFGEFRTEPLEYRFLVLDSLTNGDYSMECEVEVRRGKGAFAGSVFGQKQVTDFHGATLFPPQGRAGAVDTGYADLFSSIGGQIQTWRHAPVDLEPKGEGSVADVWHRLRVDVIGAEVDVWLDGQRLYTHRFAGREVLLGNLGLVTGPGRARFRNVRYLARDPQDPAGRVERRVRLEASGFGSGEPVGGSYQDLAAPFPEVQRWVQGSRSSWAEAGPVPQLLVMWSKQQNELIPLHGWLNHLAVKHAAQGLRIVSVVQSFDGSDLEGYLATHPFPGDVALDGKPAEKDGLGLTFDRYSIRRFNLPRLILIDPQGRVAWEGDPGFKAGQKVEEPYASYLDDPLAAMAGQYHLESRAAWREEWRSQGRAALERGDLAAAWPLLSASKDFEPVLFAEERDARIVRTRLEAIAADPMATLEWLTSEEANLAAPVVQAWLEVMNAGGDKAAQKALAKAAGHRSVGKFAALAKQATALSTDPARLPKQWAPFATKVGELKVPLVSAQLVPLEALAAAEDWDALAAGLADFAGWPARWAAARLLLP
ncbi:MAG: hypothetical protein R3E96_10485 [Planctomycetota bacterium]